MALWQPDDPGIEWPSPREPLAVGLFMLLWTLSVVAVAAVAVAAYFIL